LAAYSLRGVERDLRPSLLKSLQRTMWLVATVHFEHMVFDALRQICLKSTGITPEKGTKNISMR